MFLKHFYVGELRVEDRADVPYSRNERPSPDFLARRALPPHTRATQSRTLPGRVPDAAV